MSDDHYNQGPHRGGSRGNGGQQQGDDDGEKTQLVDLNSLTGGGDEPQFAPPPTMDSAPPPNMDSAPPPTVDSAPPPSMGSAPPPTMGSSPAGSDEFEEKTELFEIPPSMDDSDGGITSSAPDYSGDAFGQGSPSQGANHRQPSAPAPQPKGGQFSSVGADDVSSGPPAPSFGGASPQPPPPQHGGGAQQVYVPSDDDAGHDGATAFINVNDFADKDAHFTPEQEQAGYDGSTQFVDINALQAGAGGASGVDPIDNDDDLHRGYQFGPDDIQRGDVTVIYAKNALGKDVILKRVWEDEPHTMSTPLRERIAELHELQHPNLVCMNGMFVSDSGMWAELDAPRGQRLTRLIEQNGSIDSDLILEWIDPIADVLEMVHANQLAYANLTTDAIWVGNDGSVFVEPFDMLRLDDRGNLGAFGAPEMDAPPEQRNLSPASDVFSLAAVVGAAITGLPFRPQQLVELDGLAEKLLPSLSPDPSERPPTIADFRNSLKGGINLADLDIKIVGAALFAVLILGVGLMAVISGDDSSEEPSVQNGQEATAEAPDQPDDPEAGYDDDPDGAEDDPDAVAADETPLDLPRTVYEDERLSIITTFETNPPDDAVQRATDRHLDQWRTEADELIAKAEDESADEEKLAYYSSALELLTQVIRKQAEPTSEDLDTWRQIYDEEVMQDEVASVIESLDGAVADGRIGTANRRYHRLSRYNPFAEADGFMRAHQSPVLVHLGSTDDDDDDD